MLQVFFALLFVGGGGLFFASWIRNESAAAHKKGEEDLSKLHQTAPEITLFLVQQSSFTDSINGLIGNVKGDTLDLTFGSMEDKLLKVHVQLGDSVSKGKLLMELDHTRSESKLRQAQIALNRAEQLQSIGGAAEMDVQDAQALYDLAKRDYEDSFIYAPANGTISQINKQPGELVNRNEVVATFVSDRSPLYIETGVVEDQVQSVRTGQKTRIEVDALGKLQFEGEVMGVAKEVSTTGRISTVHIRLPAKAIAQLRPGISTQCQIIVLQKRALVIPRQAYDEKKQAVYVFNAETKTLRETPVSLGYRKRDFYEVVSGLKENDRIVADLTLHPMQNGDALIPAAQDETYDKLTNASAAPH